MKNASTGQLFHLLEAVASGVAARGKMRPQGRPKGSIPGFPARHPCRNSPKPALTANRSLPATPLEALPEQHRHAVAGVGARAWVHSPESDQSEGDRDAI
jgi:hypothetical protein